MHPAPDDERLPVLTEIVLLGRAALPPAMARTAPQPELPIPWDAAYDPEAAAHAAPGAPLRETDTTELWPAELRSAALAYPGDTSPPPDDGSGSGPAPAPPAGESADAPFTPAVAHDPAGEPGAPDTAFTSAPLDPQPEDHAQ